MTRSILSLCLCCLLSFVAYPQETSAWTSLFDGKSLNGWKKVAGNADYQVENGAIVGITVDKESNTFLISEKEYADFILEMEVKLEDTTLNSGIQFRSHFDPQGFEGDSRSIRGYGNDLCHAPVIPVRSSHSA